MHAYTSNGRGRAAIAAAVAAHSRADCRPDGWYADAEHHATENGSTIELGQHYTLTGRPELVDLGPECFEVAPVDD